jgi:hypothetical protein
MTINARTSQIIQKKTLPDMTLPGCIDITVMGIFSASNRRCNSAVQSTFASFVYAARTHFFLRKSLVQVKRTHSYHKRSFLACMWSKSRC